MEGMSSPDVLGATTTAAVAPQPLPFQFIGSAAEYFRISIVNLLLTLVTVGVYAPWAKVRRARDLYGSTRLAGSAFGFHGSPVALLKGRLFTLGMLAVLGVTARLFPSVAVVAP